MVIPLALILGFTGACSRSMSGSVERDPGASEQLVEPLDPCTDGGWWHPDADGDGYGSASAVHLCITPRTGFVQSGSDCDDTMAGVHPGAQDVVDDGVDQDCDGVDACGRMHPGDLWLRTAKDFAEFCEEYDGVSGTLSISIEDAVDLGSLSCLCGVSGELYLEDSAHTPTLASLVGLEGLRYVGGTFTIDAPLGPPVGALRSLELAGGGLIVRRAAITTEGMDALRYARALYLTDLEEGGLRGLRGLTDIPDYGYFHGPEMRSLEGLEGLTTAGDLEFEGMDALSDLAALSNLERVGFLGLRTSDALGSLHGLESLRSSAGVELAGLERVTSLDALESLTDISGGLGVHGCESLERVSLRPELLLQGSVWFEQLPRLTTLEGIAFPASLEGRVGVVETAVRDLGSFAGLQEVNELTVERNPDITTLGGLEDLRRVYGDLQISDNEGLTSVLALHGVRAVDGDLRITGNTSLPRQSALDLLEAIGEENIRGEITIENNGR